MWRQSQPPLDSEIYGEDIFVSNLHVDLAELRASATKPFSQQMFRAHLAIFDAAITGPVSSQHKFARNCTLAYNVNYSVNGKYN